MKSTRLGASLLTLLTLVTAAISSRMTTNTLQPAVLSSHHLATSQRASIAPAQPGLSGPQPFITLLCKFAGTNDEPVAPAYMDGLFGADYPGLDDYWREVSYGRISLAGSLTAGWYTLPRPPSAYRSVESGEIAADLLLNDCVLAADADVYFPDFVGINLVFNQVLDQTARGGEGCLVLDGEARCYGVTWLWPQVFLAHDVVAHEIGHTFGLQHSTAGRDKVYGNPWDIMSASSACLPDATYGALSPHIIAYDKDLLGWIPADKKLVVSSQGTVTIELAALSDPAARGFWLAKVPTAGVSGRFYTVESRLRLGYDRALPADAVIIHEVDPRRNPPAALVNRGRDGDTRVSAGVWAPGDVFVDPLGGVAIAVDRATATGFVVTIATGTRPWPLSPTNAETAPAGEVTITWQPVAGASGYQLRVTPGPYSPIDQMTHTVTAASATVMLPPGVYRWQVRALPAGDWTPAVRLVTGFAGRRWQSSQIVASFVSRATFDLSVMPDPNQGITIAWAAREGDAQLATVHTARPSASGWQVNEFDQRPTGGAGGSGEVVATARQVNGGWMVAIPTSGEVEGSHVSPAVATDSQGAVYAAWQRPRGCADVITTADIEFARRPAGSEWQPAAVVSRDVGSVSLSEPAIAVGADKAVYLVWEEVIAGRYVLFSSYRPPGGAWEPKMVIPDTSAGLWEPARPALTVDAAGNVYVAWLEKRENLVAIRVAAATK